MKKKPAPAPAHRSPIAAALATKLFRRRIKPSGKLYSRKGVKP